MNESFFSDLACAVDNAQARQERARNGVRIIREARNYDWVAVCDVDDDGVTIVAYDGESGQNRLAALAPSDDAIRTSTTTVRNGASGEVVVPVLGAESAVVIGTLDVRSNRPVSAHEIAFLEECAAVLRPLYD